MNPNNYYAGYPQPANNYSQNIAPLFPWSPPPSLPQNLPHIHHQPLIPPFSTSIHIPPNQDNSLPPLRRIYNEYPNNLNNPQHAGNNNNSNPNMMAPIQDNNNVNMVMDERSRREPNSASESDLNKNTMTPTKKKLLERANKLKKYPIEVDPDLAEEVQFVKHQRALENAQREQLLNSQINVEQNQSPALIRPRPADVASISQIAELTRADLASISERIGMVTNNFLTTIRESESYTEQLTNQLEMARHMLDNEARSRHEETEQLRSQLIVAQREINELQRRLENAAEINNNLRASTALTNSNSSVGSMNSAHTLNNSNNIQPSTREKKAQEIPECQVCNDDLCEVAFVPCGHFCVCQECSLKVDKCIICRSEITNKIKLFIT